MSAPISPVAASASLKSRPIPRNGMAPNPPARRDSRSPMTSAQRVIHTILLRFGPLSDGDLVRRYDALRPYVGLLSHPLSPSGIRTRRQEATAKGWITEAGETRNENNRKVTLYRGVH